MIIRLFTDDIVQYTEDYKTDIIETLKEDGRPVNSSTIYEEAQNCIDCDLIDFKDMAVRFDNIADYDRILIEAELGLWYGRRQGRAVFNNLYEALFKYCEDINSYYFKDKRCTLTLKAVHHDGTNVFRFYTIKNGKKYAIKYADMEAAF